VHGGSRTLLTVAAACCAIGTGSPRTAHAQSPIELTWEAPPECPDRSVILELLVRMRGNELATGTEAHVLVTREPTEVWRGDITLRTAQGVAKRTLRGESCQALAEATAVVLSITLQHTPPPPPPPNREKTRPVAPRSRVWAAGVSGLLDTGTLPATGVGVGIGGAFVPRGARLELDMNWLARREEVIPSKPWEGADFGWWRIGVRGCRTYGLGQRVVAGPCLSAGVEWLTGSGFGSQDPTQSTSTTLALGAGIIARLRLGEQAGLRASGEVAAPLRRPVFVIEGTGDVYRSDPAAFRLLVGPELHF